jgi:hypothetical protein
MSLANGVSFVTERNEFSFCQYVNSSRIPQSPHIGVICLRCLGPLLSTNAFVSMFGNLPPLVHAHPIQHKNNLQAKVPAQTLHPLSIMQCDHSSSYILCKLQGSVPVGTVTFASICTDVLLFLSAYIFINDSRALCWIIAAIFSFVAFDGGSASHMASNYTGQHKNRINTCTHAECGIQMHDTPSSAIGGLHDLLWG